MTRPSLSHALLAGLAAGGVAAIAAALLSLALRSPDPVFINSGSISIAVLLGGLLSGLIYWLAAARRNPLPVFAAWMGGLFLLVVVVALLVEALPGHPLLHVGTYCIPLAALALAVMALLTPVFARLNPRPLWVAPAVAIAALAVGFALAGRAGPSGHLALPQAAKSNGAASTAADGLIRLNDVKGLAFAVDPSQSKATYTVNERLSSLPAPDDAVGTTNQVSGTIYLDGRPSAVTVDVRTFKSDQPFRDRSILEQKPGLANYQPAQFTVSQLDLPSSYKPGDTINRNVQGTMTLNGIQKPMTFAIEARLQDNTLFVHGTMDFTWEDFNMQPPATKSLLEVSDTVHTEVLLVAKAQS
jgi:polyisoprenoid-binding protein YceI